MTDAFTLETPFWEIIVRATVVYFVLALIVRIMPKRHAGDISPNDFLALIVVGHLAAYAIVGESKTVPDILLMVGIVFGWDYLFNLLTYHFPRLRGFAQDSPTLLIHNGVILKENLRREKLTEQELTASLRKQGISDLGRVKQAILEVDGQISIVEND